MTIKELKVIIKKLDKNTIVKVNGNDIKVQISMNQDGQWTLNLVTALDGERNENELVRSNSSLRG